jgi:hypothetical protein
MQLFVRIINIFCLSFTEKWDTGSQNALRESDPFPFSPSQPARERESLSPHLLRLEMDILEEKLQDLKDAMSRKS